MTSPKLEKALRLLVAIERNPQSSHELATTLTTSRPTAKLLQAGDKYIDGALLAKRMGITLPPAQVPYNISAKVDAKYAALVKDL